MLIPGLKRETNIDCHWHVISLDIDKLSIKCAALVERYQYQSVFGESISITGLNKIFSTKRALAFSGLSKHILPPCHNKTSRWKHGQQKQKQKIYPLQ